MKQVFLFILTLLALSHGASADQLVTITKALTPIEVFTSPSAPLSVTGTTLLQISATLDAILAASGGGGGSVDIHASDGGTIDSLVPGGWGAPGPPASSYTGIASVTSLDAVYGNTIANQTNSPGWVPGVLGDGLGHGALNTPNIGGVGYVLSQDLASIFQNAVANQSNCPGCSPSATLDGYGLPIDGASVGTSIAGKNALITNSSIYDQYGNGMDTYSIGGSLPTVGSSALLTAGLAFDGFGYPMDSFTYDTGTPAPISGSYNGLFVVAPTIDAYGNLVDSGIMGGDSAGNRGLSTISATYNGYGAPIGGDTYGNGLSGQVGLNVLSGTYDGYGFPINKYLDTTINGTPYSPLAVQSLETQAQDRGGGTGVQVVTASALGNSDPLTNFVGMDTFSIIQGWGKGGVSDPVNLHDANFDLTGGINAPFIMAANGVLNPTADTEYSVMGSTMDASPGNNEIGMNTRAVLSAVDRNGNIYGPLSSSAPSDPTLPTSALDTNAFLTFYSNIAIPTTVQAGSIDSALPTTNIPVTTTKTDTYTTATSGDSVNFTAQNYTWQTRSDAPLSVGLAYTIVLENSIDGGTTWQTLGTKTVADVTGAPTSITGKPGSTFRTRCSSLTLGASATDVDATVLAVP